METPQNSDQASKLAAMMESWFDEHQRNEIKRRIALVSSVKEPSDEDVHIGVLKYAEVLFEASEDPYKTAQEMGPDIIADAIVRRFSIVMPPPKTQIDRLRDLGPLADATINLRAGQLAKATESHYRNNGRFDELAYCFELAGWSRSIKRDRAHHLIEDWARAKIDQNMDYKFNPTDADAMFMDFVREASIPYAIAMIEMQQAENKERAR